MGKLKFAALHRTENGIQFLMREGRTVEHNLISLGAYKNVTKDDTVEWFVVELSSGLSIASGQTYNEAVKAAKDRIQEVGLDKIRLAAEKSIKAHGIAPGRRISYL